MILACHGICKCDIKVIVLLLCTLMIETNQLSNTTCVLHHIRIREMQFVL